MKLYHKTIKKTHIDTYYKVNITIDLQVCVIFFQVTILFCFHIDSKYQSPTMKLHVHIPVPLVIIVFNSHVHIEYKCNNFKLI